MAGHAKALIVSTNAPSATKGLLLAIISGALIWMMLPLIDMARAGETGLGPYSTMALFALGLLVSTVVFNNFFLNLPVQGERSSYSITFAVVARAPGRPGSWNRPVHRNPRAAGGALRSARRRCCRPTFYALEQGAVLIGACGAFSMEGFSQRAASRVGDGMDVYPAVRHRAGLDGAGRSVPTRGLDGKAMGRVCPFSKFQVEGERLTRCRGQTLPTRHQKALGSCPLMNAEHGFKRQNFIRVHRR